MKIILDYLFSKADLEAKTCALYFDFRSQKFSDKELKDKFESYFGIGYSLVFEEKPFPASLLTLLDKYYRNEALIKYEFFTKVLQYRKSISFFELPINKSRTDIVSIGTKSTGYEIKTKYDNLLRLKKQIKDYSLCFEYLYVIAEQGKLSSISKMIPQNVGIYAYDNSKTILTFDKIREAKENPSLSDETMLSMLWKDELNQSFHNENINKILEKNSQAKIENNFKKVLQKRYFQKFSNLKRQWDFSL
jgi:hypothetical protein